MISRGLSQQESRSAFKQRKLKMDQIHSTPLSAKRSRVDVDPIEQVEESFLSTPPLAKKPPMGHPSFATPEKSLEDLLNEKAVLDKKEEELQREKERLGGAAKAIVLETLKEAVQKAYGDLLLNRRKFEKVIQVTKLLQEILLEDNER
jgi:hypothetical protein